MRRPWGQAEAVEAKNYVVCLLSKKPVSAGPRLACLVRRGHRAVPEFVSVTCDALPGYVLCCEKSSVKSISFITESAAALEAGAGLAGGAESLRAAGSQDVS